MTWETLAMAAIAFPAVLIIWYVGRWRERARGRGMSGLVVILGRPTPAQMVPHDVDSVVLVRRGIRSEVREILYEERQ